VNAARFLPASIRRAFSLMWLRLRNVLGEAPILFFGVVIGVALTFRVAVGVVREAATPAAVAPTFVTTGPEPGIASGFVASGQPAGAGTSPSTSTGTGTAEVGAAAKVAPIGMPAPPRVGPKPRGHGRRPR
jgi:hypothetical protein